MTAEHRQTPGNFAFDFLITGHLSFFCRFQTKPLIVSPIVSISTPSIAFHYSPPPPANPVVSASLWTAIGFVSYWSAYVQLLPFIIYLQPPFLMTQKSACSRPNNRLTDRREGRLSKD